MNDANELFSDAYSVVDFKILKNFSFGPSYKAKNRFH